MIRHLRCTGAAYSDHAVEGTPTLVVEILSPSNRGADLVRKRGLYADGGCGSYWIVDPSGPSVMELRLEAGVYVERASAASADRFVTMVYAQLKGGK